MAHRGDGLNDIFEHNVIVRENLTTHNGKIKELETQYINRSGNDINIEDAKIGHFTGGTVGYLMFDGGDGHVKLRATNTVGGNIWLTPHGVGDVVDVRTHKITNVIDPTANQDAATKKYVDDSAVTVTDGTTIDFTLIGQDITAETIDGAIDHDALLNFVASEHINWKSTAENFNTSGNITGGSLTIDTDVLYVDATNDRVGINSTSPSHNLEVKNSAGTDLGEINVQKIGYFDGGTVGYINFESATGDITLANTNTVGGNIFIYPNMTADGVIKLGNTSSHIQVDEAGGIDFLRTGGFQFGEIFVTGGSTAQSIGTTYTKLTGFTTDGQSNGGVINAAANDKITLGKVGKYEVTCTISSLSATANRVFTFALFLNGVQQTQVMCQRKYASAGDVGHCTLRGFIDNTRLNNDIDIRATQPGIGNVNWTPVYMNLNCMQIGGT